MFKWTNLKLVSMVLIQVLQLSAQAQQAATQPSVDPQSNTQNAQPSTDSKQAESKALPSASPTTSAAPSSTPSNSSGAIQGGQTATSTATTSPNSSSGLKSVSNAAFNRSLKYVDQLDQVQWTLDYDLESSNGEVLKMGPIELDPKSFTFKYGPLKDTVPGSAQVLGDKANSPSLLVIWPEPLFSAGVLEMISRNGQVIWKYEIPSQKVNEWKLKKLEMQKSSKAKTTDMPQNDFPIMQLKDLKFPVNKVEMFRFCLSQGEDKASTKLCSPMMAFRKVKGVVSLGRLKSDLKARVLVRNEVAKLKDSINVVEDLPTSFYADINSGISYEFVSMPPKNKVSDVLETKDPKVYQVQGWDLHPAGKYKILNPDDYGTLTKLIGFEPTIGDFRKFWSTEVSADNPYLWIPADSGGIFRRKVTLEAAPRAVLRPFLSSRSPVGTYSEEVVLRGRRQKGTVVKSTQNSVQVDSKNRAEFDWYFAAPETSAINRSYLTIESDGRKYQSYYEIYRGLANEISGRFTGVAGTGSLAILAEAAYNHWFETIGGWNNDIFSRHRWGLSGKYFQSLNNIQIDSAGTTAALTVLTLDAKYRFSAGLWGRDETTGAILSYQNVSLGTLSAPMLGVGGFWARSMPRVFDNLFNYFSIFQYPKWVDMELIYYVSPLSSSVTLDSSFSLNFHGQVMWTQSFFGEAGFGMKRYAFVDQSASKKAALNTFYGTMGIGYKF